MNEPNGHEFDFEATFEAEDYLYFYSQVLTDEVTDTQIRFLKDVLQLDRPVRILDMACGHGRHSIRLAAMGHSITGVDRSAQFLEIARADAEQKGLHIHWLQGDMRTAMFREAFDCALIMYTALGYFPDAGNDAVIRQLNRALVPGGRLCFDAINRDRLLSNKKEYIVQERGDDLMIDQNRFDPITGRNYCRRTVIRNGIRRIKRFYIRMYNYTELRDLLRRNGFEPVAAYDGWHADRPFDVDSWRIVIVARKIKDLSGESE